VAPKSPRTLARRPSSSSRGGWGGSSAAGERQQQQWRQVLQPVTDPLVKRCAKVVLPLLAAAGGGDPSSPAVLAAVPFDWAAMSARLRGKPVPALFRGFVSSSPSASSH
jgi:hypothetical protein